MVFITNNGNNLTIDEFCIVLVNTIFSQLLTLIILCVYEKIEDIFLSS